jgi:hypothetical protein
MTQEEIVYQYYLTSTTKSRNEAIELLKKRNFTLLHRNYIHWFDKKEKNVKLKSTKISDAIKELSNIKFEDNESEPVLSCCVEENEAMFGSNTESSIEITSYIYTIVPFEKCESLAKHYAKDSLWKLKHQPNGKDAESCRKILNINYEKTT